MRVCVCTCTYQYVHTLPAVVLAHACKAEDDGKHGAKGEATAAWHQRLDLLKLQLTKILDRFVGARQAGLSSRETYIILAL